MYGKQLCIGVSKEEENHSARGKKIAKDSHHEEEEEEEEKKKRVARAKNMVPGLQPNVVRPTPRVCLFGRLDAKPSAQACSINLVMQWLIVPLGLSCRLSFLYRETI